MRRAFLTLGLLTLLAACGFQPRGVTSYASRLEHIHFESVQPEPVIVQRIGDILRRASVQPAPDRASARAVLRILDDKQDSRSLTISRSGRTTEYNISHTVTFELLDARGEILLPRQDVRISREYFNDQFLAIGRQQEETLLRGEMLTELAETIARRVAWKLGQSPD